jgi:hypothetical protein
VGRGALTAGQARRIVFERDGWQCAAAALDAGAGPCADGWGGWFSGYSPTGEHLEADRVRDEPSQRAPSHSDPYRMITVCAGHHRGTGPSAGRQWATASREACRAYLSDPAVIARTTELVRRLKPVDSL